MAQIFLLAGAPAVGKSTTARALAARFPKSIHIPVDHLREMVIAGLVNPGSHWSGELIEQLSLARASAVDMAARYQQAGFVVVMDDFWDPNSQLQEYDSLSRQPNVYRILLFPSQQTAEARNQKRSGAGGSPYITEGIRTVYQHLQTALPHLQQQGWIIADTTDKTVDETAAYILACAGQ